MRLLIPLVLYLILTLPKENFYAVKYNCVLDSDRALEALAGSKKGALSPKERVKSARKQADGEVYDVLPTGEIKVILLAVGFPKSPVRAVT